MSITKLYRPNVTEPYAEWAAWTRNVDDLRVRSAARVLGSLIPSRGYFPDFLTPADGSPSLEEGIDAVLRTPRRKLRANLGRLGRLPGWAQGLADGDPAALGSLGTAMRTYHDGMLKPHWERIRRRLEADRATTGAAMLTGGAEQVLSGLGPAVRWRDPVLEVDYPVDREVHLAGRGLLLVPSLFCHGTPVSLADDDLPPVLVYPIAPGRDWMRASAPERQLEALLGRTRSAVLRAITYGGTTSQIARRLRVSPASVSEHVGVLRGSGLLASRRQGRGVVHSLTGLGSSLVAGDDAPWPAVNSAQPEWCRPTPPPS
ncbi:helix-turn-helix domain-containing protein [Lentzea albida]|uniref:helix-turn-helix domain-containing protein n=1 Tax=Lentzea albida TaxID=65499 RepID=UPI001C435247|nr:DUF5937 family protein [Lentzea albida]